jgi:hypothetical protein
MRKPEKILILQFLLLIILPCNISSQITSSPYSMFGIGKIENNSTGPFKAMGSTGIAFLSNKSVNIMNPASYSGIDSLVTIFELGVSGDYTYYYKNDDEKQGLPNANLRYILMGFRVTPWLATSFGFTPYSSIGYNINAESPLDGSNLKYITTFTGEGGINQVYLGGSATLIKNLSLGINAAYLFGAISHSESSSAFDYSLSDITYVKNFVFNYGLNYQLDFNKLRFNLGLIYTNKQKLVTDNETTVTTSYQTEELKERNYKYSIPQNIGGGIAVSKGYFSAGADYEWCNWENVKFSNHLIIPRNTNRYSLGVEFPSLGLRKGTGGMFMFRIGAEYSESYQVIDGVPINYRAITFGTGIPLRGVLSVFNLSFEVGRNGSTEKEFFLENFYNLHLDISLRDWWFKKRKYD